MNGPSLKPFHIRQKKLLQRLAMGVDDTEISRTGKSYEDLFDILPIESKPD
jgi:hypothetical protein